MHKTVPISLLIVIGLLSLCALPGAKVSAQNFDPTIMGPLTVTYEDYHRDGLNFTPPESSEMIKLDLIGRVHYPTNWMGRAAASNSFYSRQTQNLHSGRDTE